MAKSYSEGNRLLKANNEDVSDHSPAVQTKELENQTSNKHNSNNNHKKKKLDLRNRAPGSNKDSELNEIGT